MKKAKKTGLIVAVIFMRKLYEIEPTESHEIAQDKLFEQLKFDNYQDAIAKLGYSPLIINVRVENDKNNTI